ncbi:MAG: bifunctional folylpolyglutamate synthase/dihydrofolate synthase, partial [Bacteroidia bacterium]
MFQRIGAAAYKNDLTNTLEFCKALGNPETKFKSIHIAGTNGKGSTSHALASIFQKHGYKTGLYTSPHLLDFRERIRINGEMIEENDVINFVTQNKANIEAIQPSFFEATVAMAFDYFAKQNIDIAIIETGLGGRLDSTNVIIPEVSVITNISYDHTDLLGETLVEIAGEKAGIIKPGVPVIIGETQDETKKVFIDKALTCHSKIYFADENSNYYNTEIFTDLKGDYQQKNMKTVMQTVEILIKIGYPLSKFKVATALQNIQSTTGLRGRWEIV